MTPKEFGLFILSVLFAVAGQFFLKTGALKLGKVDAGNWLTHILGIATTPSLLAGLVFYGLGAITYILLLTRVELSIVGPSVALIYIFSVLIGYFVFKETIPITRIVGLGLIICGVILVIYRKVS